MTGQGVAYLVGMVVGVLATLVIVWWTKARL